MHFGSWPRCSSAVWLLILAGVAAAQTPKDFAGQWVWKLGDRNFLVLVIAPGGGPNAPHAGVLIRPKHFTTSDGRSFSQVSASVARYPIVHTEIKDGALLLVTQNPEQKEDRDTFRFSLTSPDLGYLKMIDVPFEPWPLRRIAGVALPASDWDSKLTYSPDDNSVSSAEMKTIFDEDQKARDRPFASIDWETVSKQDDAHRIAVRKLLDTGQLHTAEDFARAAFIFQHGGTSNDYLVAHTLAMVAVSKGDHGSIWIASATLDRYLNSIHQPQIFGTQFWTKPNQAATQEPYDRTLIPDALRLQLQVPSQAAQEEQRKRYDQRPKSH